MIVRRRGTAIVDTDKGILVVSDGRKPVFLLPGGGARPGESRRRAAIRELEEETGLKTYYCRYLFTYNEPNDGRRIRNLHKVFLIKAYGIPTPNHRDVYYIAFWKPGSNIPISKTTEKIIKIYLEKYKT
jgi:ADP-ribose pyrophosphatase YjhB (NUDIX family)